MSKTNFPSRVWVMTDDGFNLATGERERLPKWASRPVEDYDRDRRAAMRRLLNRDYADDVERRALHEEIDQWPVF